MPSAINARAQHQILDGASSNGHSIAAGATGVELLAGTVWPLIPQTAIRIYQASINVAADAPSIVALNSLSIFLQMLDGGGNGINLSPYILGETYDDNTLISSRTGAVAQVHGRPVLEISANFLITAAIAAGSSCASIQLTSVADVTNTDSMNAHQIFSSWTAFLSFAQL